EDELIKFQESLGYNLPVDYWNFLRLCNGCQLFDHPIYGGESYLYPYNVIADQTYEEPNDGYLKIGYIYQDNLVIDLRAYKNGSSNYLMVKDHIDHFIEAKPLNMNFEMWFDRFVVCQGQKFWEWPSITAEDYYRIES